jgi:hypothetical protein
MVCPILAGIHECRRYSSIDALLNPLNFLVPVIGRLDATDVKLEISLHNLETVGREGKVTIRYDNIPFRVLASSDIAEKIRERRM